MTETSLPWDGTTTGDAASAPYDHLEFSRMYNKILASDGAGYVVPGYLNSLNVQASSPLGASVDVATGAAYVKGFLYENDALKTLTIAANASGSPRIDRIILRVDFTAQTVRLVVLQGNPAAAPAIPALTQNYPNLWEISLAYVWVANGFATLDDSVIHDSRSMLQSMNDLLTFGTRINLIRGSELIPKITHVIAGVGNQGSIACTWFWTGLPVPTRTFTTKPPQQTRGNAAVITANAINTYVLQAVEVKPSTVYTLRSLVNNISGSNFIVDIYGIASASVLASRTIQITNAWVDETVRFVTSPTDTVVLVRYTTGNGATFHFGQAVLLEGWHSGNYDPVHELIMFQGAMPDTAWNFTAKSSALPVGISLLSPWGSLGAFNDISELSAIVLSIGGNDSGSAAAASDVAALRIYGLSVPSTPLTSASINLDLGGEVNDRKKYATGIVPAKSTLTSLGGGADVGFGIRVDATGANTFDAYVAITGIFT